LLINCRKWKRIIDEIICKFKINIRKWENSKGANLEVGVALRLKMKVITLEDLLKESK